MLRAAALILLCVLSACGEEKLLADTSWLSATRWEDGKAEISVYRGRFKRYGEWRAAEVRDYVIREYLDPRELTKRDADDAGRIKVLKFNRMVSFTTGTYDYRMMHSLFIDRDSGDLVKGVGTSQEGCGITFQRWDRRSRELSFDSYWEGEGRGTRELEKRGLRFFADEVPFLAPMIPNGTQVLVYPSLMRNNLRGWKGEPRTVTHDGNRRVFKDEDGGVTAEYAYDGDGFLESWKVHGGEYAQEFRRVSRQRLYYWQFTKPGDEKKLK